MLPQIGTLPLLPARTWRGNRRKEFQRQWWMGDSCESGEWELGFLQPIQTPGTTRWPPWLRQTTGVVGNTWRKTDNHRVKQCQNLTWNHSCRRDKERSKNNKCIYKAAWCVTFLRHTVSWWMSHRDSEHTTQWVELKFTQCFVHSLTVIWVFPPHDYNLWTP